MGSIETIEITVDTTISTKSDESDFVDVVETKQLETGKVFHVICTANVEATETNQLYKWRLYDYSNDEVVADSTMVREMVQAGKPQPYYYVGKFTVGDGSISNRLAFQQKGYALADPEGYLPAKTNFLSMLLLDMRDVNSGEYFFATEENNAMVGNTFSDRATHTITGVELDDQWLVFAWTMYYMNNTINSLISRLACDDADTTDPEIMFEGENPYEELGWWWCRSYKMSGDNSSIEWKIEDKMDSGLVNPHYCKRTTLFGIKVRLQTSYVKYDYSDVSPTDLNFFSIAERDFTPIHSGAIIAVGCSLVNMDNSLRQAGMRITEEGTTIPNSQPDTFNFINTNDKTDTLPLSYVTMYSGVAGSATQINYEVKSSSNTPDVVFSDRTIGLIGLLSPDPTVTFSAVAKQVYTSGDVASQTFDAGSKATQGFASGDVASQGFASGDKTSQSHSGGDVEAEARP